MAIKHEGSGDITREEAERLADMQDQAARGSDAGLTMIAIRWGRPQLRLVKRGRRPGDARAGSPPCR